MQGPRGRGPVEKSMGAQIANAGSTSGLLWMTRAGSASPGPYVDIRVRPVPVFHLPAGRHRVHKTVL